MKPSWTQKANAPEDFDFFERKDLKRSWILIGLLVTLVCISAGFGLSSLASYMFAYKVIPRNGLSKDRLEWIEEIPPPRLERVPGEASRKEGP